MKLIEKYSLLSECVYNSIKEAIIKGQLEPGIKISETSLAKELGVSRTPVREALRILSAEGFVKLAPNSGLIVNSFTHKDAEEILVVRSFLEGEASKMAAANITEEGKKKLQDAVNLMEEVYKLEGMEKALRFSNSDIIFHRVIFEIAGNSKMQKISESLSDRQVRFYISTNSANTELMDVCCKQHEYIMEAILAGDGVGAEKYAKEHIAYIQRMVLSF